MSKNAVYFESDRTDPEALKFYGKPLFIMKRPYKKLKGRTFTLKPKYADLANKDNIYVHPKKGYELPFHIEIEGPSKSLSGRIWWRCRFTHPRVKSICAVSVSYYDLRKYYV